MYDGLSEHEQLNLFVAEHIIGLKVVSVAPSWYDRLVLTFFEVGFPLMVYSWDSNACNASMFRNGHDEKDGFAEPLPCWIGEETEGREWEIVRAMIERGYLLELHSFKTTFTPIDFASQRLVERVPEHLAHEAEFLPLGSDHSERYIEQDEHPAVAIGRAAKKAIEGNLKPRTRVV